jgi:hypothetical protein
MRFIKSFILRLYKDSDEPDLLCGNLQIPSSQEISSLKSEAALIKLLHQLGILTAKNTHSNQRETNS